MSIASVNQQEFEEKVLKADNLVIVDFWAEWCGPCKAMLPILEELSTELKTEAQIVKVNIDQYPELAARFGVRSIPTFLAFDKGELVSNMVGAVPKSKLHDWIKGLC